MSDSFWQGGLYCPWNSPGKNTGVGCYFLLQGIFLTQRWNLGLPHCRQILYCLSHPNAPLNPPPFHSSLCLMGLTCTEFIHRVPSPPLPVCLGKGEHQQLTRGRRRFRLELSLIYPLAQLLSGDPLHTAFWSLIPVTVTSHIRSGFGEVTSPHQAVSSPGHYIILCGISAHIFVCNLFVLSSWLKPKGLCFLSALSLIPWGGRWSFICHTVEQACLK